MSDEERWKALADWLRKPGSIGDDAELADKLDPPKRKRTVWLNVYSHEVYPGRRCSQFDSRQDADRFADADRIACIRVELEEGRFDE